MSQVHPTNNNVAANPVKFKDTSDERFVRTELRLNK